MESLSSFDSSYFLISALSLLIFYGIGHLITPFDLKSKWFKFGIKLFLGVLFFTSTIAFVYCGFATMLFPFVFLGGYLAYLTYYRGKWRVIDFEDINKMLVILCILAGCLVFDMYFANVLVSDTFYLGNDDISFYSSFARNLYTTGTETPIWGGVKVDNTPFFYHYVDLWFSGFYQYFLGVLPYYSYAVIYHAIFFSIILVVLYGGGREFGLSKLVSCCVVFMIVFSCGYIGFRPPSFGMNLLTLFLSFGTFFTAFTYLPVICFIFIFFTLCVTQPKHQVSYSFILLLAPAGQALLSTQFPIGIMFFCVIILISRRIYRDYPLITSIKSLFLLFLSAFSTWGIAVLFRRMPHYEFAYESYGFAFYVFINTLIRTVLSSIMILPYLVGCYFFLKRHSNAYSIILFLSLYIGYVVSFSLVYTLLGDGDTMQIHSIYIFSFIIPFGILGLFEAMKNSLVITRYLAMVLLIVAFIANCFCTPKAILGKYDLHSESIDYMRFMNTSLDDTYKLISLLPRDKNYIVGLYYKELENGNTNLSRSLYYLPYTYLQGLRSNLSFIRLNVVRGDSLNAPVHTLSFYKSTIHCQIENRYNHNDSIVSRELLNRFNPDILFSTTDDGQNIIIPYDWEMLYPKADTCGKIIIHSK